MATKVSAAQPTVTLQPNDVSCVTWRFIRDDPVLFSHKDALRKQSYVDTDVCCYPGSAAYFYDWECCTPCCNPYTVRTACTPCVLCYAVVAELLWIPCCGVAYCCCYRSPAIDRAYLSRMK